jgi:hypothetical protein
MTLLLPIGNVFLTSENGSFFSTFSLCFYTSLPSGFIASVRITTVPLNLLSSPSPRPHRLEKSKRAHTAQWPPPTEVMTAIAGGGEAFLLTQFGEYVSYFCLYI